MEASFWHRKWESNEIGFHQHQVNALLVRHFGQLSLAPGSRVFLPLCGKTLDIHWLLAQGYTVLGAELSELAVQQLFSELQLTPEISDLTPLNHTDEPKSLRRYAAANLQIYVGDIFALPANVLGQLDAIYDRAALVALPAPMRVQYANLLQNLQSPTGKNVPQLLITLEYDQSISAGPPFSIPEPEITTLYGENYRINALEHLHLPDGLKGKYPVQESVWYLEPKV